MTAPQVATNRRRHHAPAGASALAAGGGARSGRNGASGTRHGLDGGVVGGGGHTGEPAKIAVDPSEGMPAVVPEAVIEAVPQPLRYMAREYDEVTGLYQVRARWYDAQYGRFVSEDPIGLAGGHQSLPVRRERSRQQSGPVRPVCALADWIEIKDAKGQLIAVQIIGIYMHGDDCQDPDGGGGGGDGRRQPTDKQREYIECVASQWLTTGHTILSRLNSGLIFVTDQRPRNQSPRAVMWTHTELPTQPIVIFGGPHGTNGGAFASPVATFAFYLGHEPRHVAQSDGTLMPRRLLKKGAGVTRVK